MWSLRLFTNTYTHISSLYIYTCSSQSFHWIPQIHQKKQKKMKVWTCIFLITFFINKVHFEKVTKGTPLSGFLSQNNLHVSTQLINTLSPPGLILLIISALLHALITWQSYESHSKSHESLFFGFLLYLGGSTLSSRETF